MKPNREKIKKGRPLSRRGQTWLAAALLLAPSLAGVAVFCLLPFLEVVRRSFTDAMGRRFVGLDNYRTVLQNSAFRIASANTARFVAVCIPLLLAASLVLALLVRAAGDRGRPFRTTYLLPLAIPVASIVLLWKVLFAEKGLANTLLALLGAQTVDFMGSDAAFWVLIATYLWKNSGYDMVLWIAGLDRIPAAQYEAAAVDGAGSWQVFCAITWPGLRPTLGLAALLSLINSFKVFREAYLVAGSYPHQSIYLLQHLFNNWFLNLELGRITAAAVLVVTALLAVAGAAGAAIGWKKEEKKMLKRMLRLGLLVLLALFTWWVLWFMAMGALTPEDELLATIAPALGGAGERAVWSFLPSWPTLQPLVQLLLDTPVFFTMFWNACKLVFPQILGQLAVAAPAAWVFSKLPFPGRRWVYGAYLVLMVLPFQITMVSNYLVLDALGLMDTPWAVILPGIFSTFPVFIMKKGFDAVPDSLLEAAALDGAGPLGTFVRIGLPLGLPGICSALVLSFIEAWNAIEQPMLFLRDQSNWPLSLYLSNITVEDLGLAMVASLLMLAPPLLLFLVGQNYLEQGIGLSAGASEGM